MEKERLLEDDEDLVPTVAPRSKEHFYSRFYITTLRAYAFLLLSSICLNGILSWLLLRQQHHSHETSEHGSLANLET